MDGLSLRFGGPDSAERLLAQAQSGVRDAREQLLQDFTPLIIQVASQATGRYLQPGTDEEISVALLAFDEAIDAFVPGRGSFVGFARMVIRRRLVDYFRRRRDHPETVWSALEERDDEGHTASPVLDRVAQQAWRLQEEQAEWQREIEEYRNVLDEYGISLEQLLEESPKRRDARLRALQAARHLASEPALVRQLEARRALPLKQLQGLSWGTRKTLERHRRYIIAVALIWMHDWPHLQAYVTPPEEGAI